MRQSGSAINTSRIPTICKVILGEQNTQVEPLQLLVPATLTAKGLEHRIRKILKLKQWEWGTTFFGVKQIMRNSTMLHRIDNEFKVDNCFLNVLLSGPYLDMAKPSIYYSGSKLYLQYISPRQLSLPIWKPKRTIHPQRAWRFKMFRKPLLRRILSE